MGAAGDQSLIMAIGTFADQENVWLPSSYLEMGVAKGGIAHLDSDGIITALGDGSTYIFARRGSVAAATVLTVGSPTTRSEEHTSELQSLMRISYAVFCLKKKKSVITTAMNESTSNA